MLQKHDDLKVVVARELRGGKGDATQEHFLDERQANGAGRLFCKFTLPPGASIGVHQHVGDSEVYYMLKGKALLTDNGNPVEIGPGDAHFCQDGDTHGIENIGDADLEFIALILYTGQRV
ncbi:MAG: cupin domain-containing protein [Desulfovibrio sp.]|jgi:mannose-6-phosphate isomerase-like protein (cupin superfamily)|nr:cupin domain-containing protein [Desulfovibrio sp.]